MPNASPKAALLAELRTRIRHMEGRGEAADGAAPAPPPGDATTLDAVLPAGGLSRGRLHEVSADDPGVGTAFAAALLARLAAARAAPVVWIVRGRDLHAAGLTTYGLTPDRLIAVRAVREADALWAMEEALRCKRLAAVLGEVGGLTLTACRRLQLAAEAGGVAGLLLRLGEVRTADPSAAATRWRVAAAPSAAAPDEPGVGTPRWQVELVGGKERWGAPGRAGLVSVT